MNTVDKVIDVAMGEVGYREKAINKNLDDFTANAGSANFTKYARDYNDWGIGDYQGQAWCDVFVDWCFIKAYGLTTAQELLGGFSAWTPSSAQNFKNMNRWSSKPSRGAVVFFRRYERINHTGIVTGVGDGVFYTIEGNADNMVRHKEYSIDYTKIAGFGIPAYDKEKEEIDIKNYVTNMYPALLGRMGSDSEIAFWVNWYNEGHTFSDVYDGFVQSTEFRRKYVTRLYTELLGRSCTDKERDFWVKEIECGMSLAEVYEGFIDSEEYRRKGV